MRDIAILDPEKVTNNSTYQMGEQGLPIAGAPYVIVSGEVVVKDSEFRKLWAGQPIRFPLEEKGPLRSRERRGVDRDPLHSRDRLSGEPRFAVPQGVMRARVNEYRKGTSR